MDKWLRMLALLTEGLSSVPRTHVKLLTASCDFQFQGIPYLLLINVEYYNVMSLLLNLYLASALGIYLNSLFYVLKKRANEIYSLSPLSFSPSYICAYLMCLFLSFQYGT